MAKLDMQAPGLQSTGLQALGLKAKLSLYSHNIRHELIYAAQRLPWQMSIGIVLLASSLAIGLGLALPQYSSLQTLNQQLAEARKQKALHPPVVAPTPQTASQAFYGSLPAETDMPKLIAVLMQAASEQGIQPDNAQYQIARSTAAAYSRYQITLPVHADYVVIRLWINAVLNRLPNAALNEINISRDLEHEGQVEARLKFTFYMGHAR